MIFVTVGTQAPFDRLIKVMDEVAGLLNTDEEFISQAINTGYIPKNMQIVDFLPPMKFDALFNNARLIIGHAGTGTILSALTMQKPILIMPRNASLGEHRNEHQLATAEKFGDLGLVKVAKNEIELREFALQLILDADAPSPNTTSLVASEQLIKSIRGFIKDS